jgi:uncharacterized membrane protein YqjE
MSETAAGGGLFASLRGLLSTLIETLQVRLDLLATELEEEQLRLLRVLGFGAAALFLLAAGLLFFAVFLIVWLWDEHRLLVLGILSVMFLGGGGIALQIALREWHKRSRLFSASLVELAHDREQLDRQGGGS